MYSQYYSTSFFQNLFSSAIFAEQRVCCTHQERNPFFAKQKWCLIILLFFRIFIDFDDIVATISIFSGILTKADDIPQNKKGRSFKLGGTLRKGGQ